MCKKSVLPLGYCPEKITNAMVRRERAIRRLRPRVTINDEGMDVAGDGWIHRNHDWRSVSHRVFRGRNRQSSRSGPTTSLELQENESAFTGTSDSATRLRRQEIAHQRARELLGNSAPTDDADLAAEESRPRWRKAVAKVFPGF